MKSSQIEFDAKGAQAELLGAARAANGEILLAKMRGGQVRLAVLTPGASAHVAMFTGDCS